MKRFGRAVRDQLCVNGSITLIDAEDRLFKRAPSPFSGAWPPTNPGGAKETFINLNHTKYLSQYWKGKKNKRIFKPFGLTRIRGRPGPRKRGRGMLKQLVFGICEREGAVCIELVTDCPAKTLQAIIKSLLLS